MNTVCKISVFVHGGSWADGGRYGRIRDYFGEQRTERDAYCGLRLVRRCA